jgi:hypothetical protein
MGIRVRARALDCDVPDSPAIVVTVRDAAQVPVHRDIFPLTALCTGEGYATLASTLNVREDAIRLIDVDTTGVADVLIDRIDILPGYRQIRQARAVVD